MDGQIGVPPPPPPPPPPLPAFLSAPVSPESTSVAAVVAPPPPAPAAPTPTATTTVQDRIWLHAWTPAEMREHASHWSLAGDAGLLRSLEQFSDRLVQRADTIQQHLSQTVNAVKSTHTRVQNCLNDFLSLANTQFIENRVYEEDEAALSSDTKKEESTNEKSTATNADAQEKVLQRYVEAIQYGLAVLDSHFERVDPKFENGDQSMLNDDDDDDAGISLEPILEPKDPYICRPLPLLIGTSQFMQDPYVGLGDLLLQEEEEDQVYGFEPSRKPVDLHSIDESSYTDEEDNDDEQEFTAQEAAPSIVPAGASQPSFNKPSQVVLTDEEDADDDDPFGVGPSQSKFTDFTFNTPAAPSVPAEPAVKPANPKKNDFGLSDDEDDENDPFFAGTAKKPTLSAAPPSTTLPPLPPISTSDNDEQTKGKADSDEEDEEEEEQKKPVGVSIFGSTGGMSALEQAVAARRRKMEGIDEPEPKETEKEKPKRKSTKTANDPLSGTTSQPIPPATAKPPAQTAISSGPTSKPSIFGTSPPSDDDADIFGAKTISKPVPPPSSTNGVKAAPKKEKDLFDDDSEEDSIFAPTPKSNPVKKPESVMPTLPSIIKQKPVIVDDSSDDDILGTKKPPLPPAATTTKTATTTTAKKEVLDSDDDPLFPKATTAPIKKPAEKTRAKDDDSEDELFTEKKKPPAGGVSVLPIKLPNPPAKSALSDDDDEDPLSAILKKPTTQNKVEAKPVNPPAIVPSAAKKTFESDDDDDPLSVLTKKPTPTAKVEEKPIVRPPPPPASSAKKIESDDDDDPLSVLAKKPAATVKVEEKPIVPPSSAKKIESDEDEDPWEKKSKKPTDLGPKPLVKNESDDDDGLFGPKAPSKPSASVPSTIKAPTKAPISDDDDDDKELFGRKPAPVKLPTQTTPSAIPKPSTTEFVDPLTGTVKKVAETPSKTVHSESEEETTPTRGQNPAAVPDGERPNVKNILGKMNIPVGAHLPGAARPKAPAVTKETKPFDLDSDEETPKTTTVKDLQNKLNIPIGSPMKPPPAAVSTKIEEDNATKPVTTTEPTPDQTMLNIAKDRAKVARGNRAPPSRRTRPTGTTMQGTDDLFGVSEATTVASPPQPVEPVKETSATGLTAPSASSLVRKEKKKFSLFDSDDSDLDDLLFGSIPKKPTAATTTTTRKATNKSILPDLDDDDFLSRRPVKKPTKTVTKDNIFDDDDELMKKPTGTNKAKKDWSILDSNKEEKPSKSKSGSSATRSKVLDDVDDIFG